MPHLLEVAEWLNATLEMRFGGNVNVGSNPPSPLSNLQFLCCLATSLVEIQHAKQQTRSTNSVCVEVINSSGSYAELC